MYQLRKKELLLQLTYNVLIKSQVFTLKLNMYYAKFQNGTYIYQI